MVEKVARCKRCGRKLTNPLFIKLGFGKTCYVKACRNKSHLKKLFDERMVINSGKNTNSKSN